MTCLREESDLLSSFSAAEYAKIESGFTSATNHIDVLCLFIQKNILPNIKRGSFLDIGAGPGFVTRKLKGYFNETIALDPNNYYADNYFISDDINNLRFVNKSFESVNFDQKFNFILCSHVLYHIPQSQWTTLIEKILKVLEKKGKALLTLVAPRGPFHDLCNQINPNYSNSKELKSILKTLNIDYNAAEIKTSYFYKNMHEFVSLMRMFVIDDCFLPEEYACIPEREIKTINQKIRNFVHDCYDKKNNLFSIQIDEDYMLLNVN